MKMLVALTVGLVLTAGTAFADPLANMYGNTVTVTDPDGKTSKGYVNPDMTWEQHFSDGTVVKGTFTATPDGTYCFTQTSPAPSAPPNCSKVEAHNVGDTWTQSDKDNKTTTFVLSAGR